MLIVNGNFLAPFVRPVVVIGGDFFKIGFKGMIVNPPVKIENFRLIFID